MRIAMPAPVLRILLALALALPFGGCGVGASTTAFVVTGIGPEGGTVAAGDVVLEIPAGALVEPTAVAILPEDTPLPILPAAGDPCTYGFLGPIWCCGPVGLDLVVAGRLRIAYDESLLPAAVPETDLVLLLWDDALGALVPTTDEVVHDVEANAFEATVYDELGHVAVGIRTCQDLPPDPDLLFLGFAPFVDGVAALVPGGDGLYLATADGSAAPVQLPTEDVPGTFLPSPDGSRVLFATSDPQSEATRWSTLAFGDAAPVTVIDTDRNLIAGEPLVGWLRSSDAVHLSEYLPGPELLRRLAAVLPPTNALSTAPADGATAPEGLYGFPADWYPVDLRLSDDGTVALLRLQSYDGRATIERIDVVDLATGDPVSVDVIPVGGGQQTPRFLPGTTDVYGVADDRLSVFRRAADGADLGTLFDVADEGREIQDFVVGPDGATTAWVLRTLGGQTAADADALWVGTLAGGAVASTDLLGAFVVAEMVFHPGGARVYLEVDGRVRSFLAADAAEEPDLPVATLPDLDVQPSTGRLLLNVRPRYEGTGDVLPGLYVADADGTNLVPVDTGGLEVYGARWRRGWRTAPGLYYPAWVR